MANYYPGKAYQVLQKELIDWVWNNEKLRQKITQHNLQYLFEFDRRSGLSIDLRRFEPEYYREVFYPPEENGMFTDQFVRKVCRVIHKNLEQAGKGQMTLTITVRHMVSEVSYWKTFFLDKDYSNEIPSLTKKDKDWCYGNQADQH